VFGKIALAVVEKGTPLRLGKQGSRETGTIYSIAWSVSFRTIVEVAESTPASFVCQHIFATTLATNCEVTIFVNFEREV
jgi:hypothetical protein